MTPGAMRSCLTHRFSYATALTDRFPGQLPDANLLLASISTGDPAGRAGNADRYDLLVARAPVKRRLTSPPVQTARPEEPIAAGRLRVVIEAVSPEVDGGRFPSNRSLGERVAIEADVFAD